MERLLDARANAQQVATARIIIGINAALAALEAFRLLTRLLRPLVLELPVFAWLPMLPASALRAFIALWCVAALFFILGWKTRPSGAVLVLLTGYTLLLDQQTYSNHLYLLVLILLLSTIADSGAAWSLDARRQAPRNEVAAWPVVLLKTQVSIVYFFSAVAKITPQYLAGEILTRSLKQHGALAVPAAWRTPAVMSFLAVASIVIELFIAFGLWSRRLRPVAILAGIAFHLWILAVVDSSRLSLSIFALNMFAVYVLFLDADLMERLKSKLTRSV